MAVYPHTHHHLLSRDVLLTKRVGSHRPCFRIVVRRVLIQVIQVLREKNTQQLVKGFAPSFSFFTFFV